jgi:hypothetical protein
MCVCVPALCAQPPQPFLHEATDFVAMLVEGEAAQQAVGPVHCISACWLASSLGL